MSPRAPRQTAYVCVEADRQVEYDVPLDALPPAPQIGQVFVFTEPLPESYIRDEQDGPIRDIIHLQRIALANGQNEDGSPTFSREASRTLALLQIGSDAERVLRERLHAITEEVRDLVANVFDGHPELESTLRQLDAIEQRFLREW